MRDLLVGGLGTSLTAGTYDGDWHDTLRLALMPHLTKGVRCLNFGLPGGTSSNGKANPYLSTIARLRLDAAVIEFAINDASNVQGISTAQSAANAQVIISALRAANPAILIFMMITGGCVAGSVPASYRGSLSTYYQKYRDMVTADPTLHLIDPAWGTATYANIPDGIHPKRAHWASVAIPQMATVMAPRLAEV